MLSEENKDDLRLAVATRAGRGELEGLQRSGPAELIDHALQSQKPLDWDAEDRDRWARMKANVESNRAEAEAFLAGLLGLV